MVLSVGIINFMRACSVQFQEGASYNFMNGAHYDMWVLQGHMYVNHLDYMYLII